MEQLEFKLEKFEGPLDLLLHLIDKNKVDIYDIPISEITDQYMEYVDKMSAQVSPSLSSGMDSMSSFLVMAATLLDIKCRMLLPREKDEKGEEIDPRDELVRKLLEYKMYRYMSEQLREKEAAAACSLYRTKQLPKEVAAYVPPTDYQQLIGDTTITKLNEIFRNVLKRQKFRVDPVRSGFGKIEAPKVDLDQKELYIKAFLNQNRHTDFQKLLEKNASKDEVVVTFLVILELIKTGNVRIRQDSLFGRITIDTVGYIRASESVRNEYTA